MTPPKKQGFAAAQQHIDIRLDGLFGELGKALGEAIERLEEGVGEIRQTHDIETGKGPIRAEAGIRVRMGGETFEAGTGASHNRQRATEPKPKPPEKSVRPISGMILNEPGLWSLSADLPGVTTDDLELRVAEGVLTITAEAAGRKYAGDFEVPDGVTEATIEVSINNGILDLTTTLTEGDGA